ncbi:MAG: DNA helicase [Candidatus Carbobacillus altaicus]|uniref:DNA helicase n=1 Tax=Candidatus Carbonibacillus altaicus TaxID=2163959 RepID=A0A2R6XXZ0_9BACL|nr:MAG: DNA helicase [Candidatus Carbobacillus altaicus]
MRDLFPEARGSERAVVASTVHRFQGLEKDVILFDAVDGPPFSKAGVLLEGDAAARLINVAMSRARGKLIILGNRTFLQDRLSAEHPLNRLSRELEARGRIVDLRNALDFQADGMGAAGDALAIVPIEPADEADADEADADRDRAFRDDLRSAEELIVLRTDESSRLGLLPELQAFKDRGRKIVLLRARGDAPDVAASPEHIRQGWEVRDIPARYVGEEWALIDNRLLWYVSRERSSGFGIRVASSRGSKRSCILCPPSSGQRRSRKWPNGRRRSGRSRAFRFPGSCPCMNVARTATVLTEPNGPIRVGRAWPAVTAGTRRPSIGAFFIGIYSMWISAVNIAGICTWPASIGVSRMRRAPGASESSA